ncbi:MAG: energy transducer TonB, partial [Bacteroidetes bacterium]|nr:energy transducer TonB [Bacteroidota bacterium]
MNAKFNSAENFTELVFENKNKAYGAYAIRKSYSDNVTISLLLSSAFFGIIAFMAVMMTTTKPYIPSLDQLIPEIFVEGTEVVIPEKPKTPPQPKALAAPKTETGQLTASDNKADLTNKLNDDKNFSKTPNPDGDSSNVKDPEPKVPVLVVPVTNKIEKFAQIMPEMEGMSQFIRDNLKYPSIAVDNGTKGVVYVTFVVDLDGSINDIKLIKGIGDGCEQEALRVVAMMPKWTPGMTEGKPVRVQCTLPV